MGAPVRDSDLIFVLASRFVALAICLATLLWLLDAGGCI